MNTAVFGFLPGQIFVDLSAKLLNVSLKLPVHLLDGLPRRQLDGILLRLDHVMLLLCGHELLLHIHDASLKVIHQKVDALLLVTTGRSPRWAVIVWSASCTLVTSLKDQVCGANSSSHLISLSVGCRIALHKRLGPRDGGTCVAQGTGCRMLVLDTTSLRTHCVHLKIT